MKKIFVDESGNLGKKDRFFVIAMLVPQRSKRIINFVKHFIVSNSLREIKAAQLSFSEKQNLLQKLNKANDCVVSYIVLDKNNIENKKLFEDKNLIYNYLFSLLVRNTIKYANEDIMIFLDNHSVKVKSVNSLSDYIKIKAFTEWDFRYNLTIQYVNSVDSKVVQATDVAANAIYAKYQHNKDHLYNKLTINGSMRFPYTKFNK